MGGWLVSACASWEPRAVAFSRRPSSWMVSITALAAAHPRAFPPKVPPARRAGKRPVTYAKRPPLGHMLPCCFQ